MRTRVGSDEYPRLVEVWRSAVDATHGFLRRSDRDEIERRLPSDYLPHVRLVVAERGDEVVGFAGVAHDKLEMLFVDAGHRGSGVGSALLSHVIDVDSVRYVDVNEDNAEAVAFYRNRGFTVVGRSDLDDDGRPYPLLRMERRPLGRGTQRPKE
ncbi:GCN5 family acetyltransferase [Mycobacterium sp. 1081908.1]|nr:acetyltransferase [Mycobacterium sp. 1081908.1]OBK47145.1 GCN5 family acetyltransferase [Mycobacterium sp. 1081908.1]